MDERGGAALDEERDSARLGASDPGSGFERVQYTDTRPKESTASTIEFPREHDRIVAGVPAYNEAVSIGSVVVAASRFVDEVIVVDDGSVDETAAIAANAGATVLQREENGGKGAAIRTLIEYLETREFQAVVLLDGDGQHDPNDIPRVVEPIVAEEADLVIGSRYVHGDTGEETPVYRRLGQRFLDLATNTSSGTRLGDSQSGFRALSAETVAQMSTRSDGYSIESEMISDASRNGLRILEAPIDVRYKDLDGQSSNPLSHGFQVVSYVNGLIRRRHPLFYFGIPGAVLLLGGLFYTTRTVAQGGAGDSLSVVFGNWVAVLGGVFVAVGLVLHVILAEFQYRLGSDDE